WTPSRTPPPSMSSATHDVPASGGASPGARALSAGAAEWHAERAMQSGSAECLHFEVTVRALHSASERLEKTGLWARSEGDQPWGRRPSRSDWRTSSATEPTRVFSLTRAPRHVTR